MINTIAWSKNRACQLDLTLSTYKKYFNDWQSQILSIIYTSTNPQFEQGYEIVKRLHPEFNWVRETNFREDTIRCFDKFKRPYTTFMVDDDVFIDFFSTKSDEFKIFANDPGVMCVAPRLAPYVTYCYPATEDSPPPQFLPNYEKKVWNWQLPHLRGDWCYPWSVSGHQIFKTEDLETPIHNIPFRFANTFEGVCLYGNMGRSRPNMVCFETAKVICGVNNKVQIEAANRHENTDPVELLNMLLLQGKRLCPNANHQTRHNSCHGIVKLKFI